MDIAWKDGFSIKVRVDDSTVVISANKEGLLSLAAQLAAELLDVDAVPGFFDQVHHVQGDDYRDAQLGELGGQVEVAL